MFNDSMSYCDCESEATYLEMVSQNHEAKNFPGTHLNSLVMFT